MSILESIILGIIQGLTEFLPVSSSGHIELGKAFLDVRTKDNLLFSIVVHGATALSTIVVFRKDIVALIRGALFSLQWNEEKDFIAKIALSMLPVAIVGVLFEEQIESFFSGKIIFVAIMLLITGVLLGITYFMKNNDGSVSYWKAIVIGIAQAIAILPGISRSGATIATALILGVNKEKATRFSFLMVLVPILGAVLIKTLKLIKTPEMSEDISPIVLLAGFIVAFITGILACNWMVRIVKKGKLIYFALYCFVVGILVIALY